MSLTIAFLGFGEVGQLFTRRLAGKPDVAVSVYDTLFDDPRSEGDLKRRAAESGPRDRERRRRLPGQPPRDLCRYGGSAPPARQADPSLDRSQIADLNSMSPTTKRLVAEEACRGGAGFVEFAVMAPVSGSGIAVPILAGGRQAEKVACAQPLLEWRSPR